MAYPYGGPNQNPTQPWAAYDASWTSPPQATTSRTSPANRLGWLVLVFGLATYLLSCITASPAGGSWGVRFSALAAVVVVLSLLPRRRAHTTLVAALALMGFLEAVSRVFTAGHDPSWNTILVVVLNGLQSVAAIAAVLVEAKETGEPNRGITAYDAYAAYYAQVAQQYYRATSQQHQQPVQAHGTAQAYATASPQATAASLGQTEQAAAQRDALYAEYVSGQHPGANPAGLAPQSGRQAPRSEPAAATGATPGFPGERSRPASDPTTGPPTQFP